MNLNLITYCIYLCIASLLIIKVGSICYKNGNIFVSHLIPDDKEFSLRVNNILLIGYYLINIGYAIVIISDWLRIDSVNQIIESIASRIAIIMCFLAALHYFNLFWITKFIKNFK